jgi:hypothetical protein
VCCVHWSGKDLLSSASQPSSKVLCHVELIFHVIMSRLKPIALSNFVQPSNESPENVTPKCPPVTGWRGLTGPVRNNFDDSGFFRGRTDSASKRRRTESQAEIDAAYDLSRDYLTNNPPPKPVLDPVAVKEVLVAATALASNIKPILDKPDATDDMKNIVNMMMIMMTVLEAVVEK